MDWKERPQVLGNILHHHHSCAHDCARQLPPTTELNTSLASIVPVVPGRCVVPLVPAVVAGGWPQIGENYSVPPPCCCSHAPAAHVLRTTPLRFNELLLSVASPLCR